MTRWGKRKIGPLMAQWNIILGALWWRNGQIRDPSDDKIGAPWWPDEEIQGPRPQILFKRFNTASLHSNLWAPNFDWEILDVVQAEKEYMGPQFSIVHLIFQRWLPMFDFGIFCFLRRLIGIYRVGASIWVFEKFRSLFSFLLLFFFSFLHFFFVSLYRGPL